jgi:phosphate transport system substrate-binding protein
MILSKSGQSIVEKDGYIPLPRSVVDKEFKKLGLN